MKIIVAIRDRAIDSFMQPWFVQARGQAVRAFGDEINTSGNPLNQHPEDFDLYVIGTYDEEKGQLIAQQPEQIAIGKDQVRS